MACGKPIARDGMLYSTQSTQVLCGAAGSGASGSSTISAKLFAAGGISDQDKGGETFLPSQVWVAGMLLPALNADEVRVRLITCSLFPDPASAAAAINDKQTQLIARS